MERRASSTEGAVTALVALVLALVVLAGSIFFALPSNVLSIRDGGPVRKVAVTLLPQGWAFFTKPPSESEAVVYAVDGERAVDVNRPPQARVENWWGLSRRQRAQGPEVAQLVSQATAWRPCPQTRTALGCVAAAAARASYEPVGNRSPVATVCGRALVVETEPVRWEFRHFYDEERRALQFAALEVDCS